MSLSLISIFQTLCTNFLFNDFKIHESRFLKSWSHSSIPFHRTSSTSHLSSMIWSTSKWDESIVNNRPSKSNISFRILSTCIWVTMETPLSTSNYASLIVLHIVTTKSSNFDVSLRTLSTSIWETTISPFSSLLPSAASHSLPWFSLIHIYLGNNNISFSSLLPSAVLHSPSMVFPSFLSVQQKQSRKHNGFWTGLFTVPQMIICI